MLLDNIGKRIIPVIAVILVFTVAGMMIRWGLGQAMAVQADFPEQAEDGIGWAPSDPETYFAAAVLRERSFAPEDTDRALAHLERAAALSPYNYLLWLELGRARDRAGEPAAAEAALRHSLFLAPNYSAVQWALGNNLIRQGRDKEGFTLIRAAVDADPAFLRPAIGVAWNVLDKDAALITDLLGNSFPVRLELLRQLVASERLDEALKIWSDFDHNAANEETINAGKVLMGSLVKNGRFRDALSVDTIVFANRTRSEIGKVTNGGFEGTISADAERLFDWRLESGTVPQIRPTDGTRLSGAHSLVFVFGSGTENFRKISQIIAVEPGVDYAFEAYHLSKLETQADLQWVVKSVSVGKVIGTSQPMEKGPDWKATSMYFRVPDGVDGVEISLIRTCSGIRCLIGGVLFIDDVSLKSR